METPNARGASPALPYQNPSLPIAVRVADLLGRMSLEEKVAQMQCVWRQKDSTLLDEQGQFSPEVAQRSYGHGHGLGQVGRPGDWGAGTTPRQGAELANAIQRFFIENSRLGIPVFFHDECLHGLMANGSTSFPQPIGLGATFDPDLVQRLYRMAAQEAALRGIHQALTPVVDVARDPRWGRVEETFGEDPYLVSRMGVAAVRGFQGDGSFADRVSVVATLKHFAAHGQPESGTNCAPVNVSERIVREVFLYPFQKAVMEAGALSVMPSYNEIDGVPSHANQWLLRRVLRGEWGFGGTLVSDYFAIRELNARPDGIGHRVAADGQEAAIQAVRAGVNIELPEPDCYSQLVDAVREGLLREAEIDELVAPLLHQKFLLGLFEDPYVDPSRAERAVGSEEHAQLALEAAQKTITLLKNEGAIVPLSVSGVKTIAVIGPNASCPLLGGYSGRPVRTVSVLQGIAQHVGPGVEVLHHQGCSITLGGGWWDDEVITPDPMHERELIAQAVAVARRADVVVLALGDNEQTSREAWSPTHMGDRASLELVGLQDELVDALWATGKPIVALLFNGKPLSVANLASKAQALFECWYLGQEAGTAVAQALFGDINPGGKLPITIPRSVGHIPAYYNYKPTARRGYLFDPIDPLFPFGFGLSYTRFEMSLPALERETISVGQTARVTVGVRNVGPRAGDEVVQLYIRDLVSSVTRPVKELKGFKRITLAQGQRQEVTFEITPELLSFYNLNMERVVEPGEFAIMVGSSSRDADLQTVTLRVQP